MSDPLQPLVQKVVSRALRQAGSLSEHWLLITAAASSLGISLTGNALSDGDEQRISSWICDRLQGLQRCGQDTLLLATDTLLMNGPDYLEKVQEGSSFGRRADVCD